LLSGASYAEIKIDVQPLWNKNLGEHIDSVKVFEREVFIAKGGNTITLATTTGRVKWNKTFENRVTAITLNRLFLAVSLSNGELLVLDHSGNRLWSNKTDNYVGGNDALTLTEEGLYAGDMSGFVYLFDLNGTPLWKADTDAYVTALRKSDGSLLVVSDKGIYRLENEELTRRISTDGYIRATYLDSNLSVISSDKGELITFNSTGDTLWSQHLESTVGRVCSFSEGVAAGTKEEEVHVIGSDGAKRWSTKVDGSVTQVFLNRDYVLAVSMKNKVYAFNWRGRPLWVNYEQSQVTALDANEQGAVYGTADGIVKYFVLAPKTADQFYIVFAFTGAVVLAGLLMVVKNWQLRRKLR
jgi:hypothetical protein